MSFSILSDFCEITVDDFFLDVIILYSTVPEHEIASKHETNINLNHVTGILHRIRLNIRMNVVEHLKIQNV